MGGSTDREGRVEVCMGGRRWRTVCTGSQEQAGAVCSQMGYIFEGNTRVINACTSLIRIYLLPTESTVNSFPPGAFPEYRLNCAQLSNGTWHCSPVEQQCDSFVELGVICKNYEDLYNECSGTSTLSTNMQVTTPLTSTRAPSTRTDNSTTFIAVIGVLVALLLAVSVGWIVSCVILLRRGQTVHKQQ